MQESCADVRRDNGRARDGGSNRCEWRSVPEGRYGLPQSVGAPLAGLVRQGENLTGLQLKDAVGQCRGDRLALRAPACSIGDEDDRDLATRSSGAEGRHDAGRGGEGCHTDVQVVLRGGQAGGSYQPGRLGCSLRGTVDHGVPLVGGPGVRVVGLFGVGGKRGGLTGAPPGIKRQGRVTAGSSRRWRCPDG